MVEECKQPKVPCGFGFGDERFRQKPTDVAEGADWGAAHVSSRWLFQGRMIEFNKNRPLHGKESLTGRGILSALRVGSGSVWGAPQWPQAPLRDPVRKESGSRERVFPAAPKDQEPGAREGQREDELNELLARQRGEAAWPGRSLGSGIRCPRLGSLLCYRPAADLGRHLTSLSRSSPICKMARRPFPAWREDVRRALLECVATE